MIKHDTAFSKDNIVSIINYIKINESNNMRSKNKITLHNKIKYIVPTCKLD